MDDFSDKDVQYFQIMDSFLQRYTLESQLMGEYLDILDETERREAIGKNAPHAAQFLESHTREELQTKLMILSIAAGVSEAIVEANRILH